MDPQQQQANQANPALAQAVSSAAADAQKSQVAEEILQRVFTRVAHVFTKEDAKELARIEEQDKTGDAVKYFLLSRVPHFEAILQEEIEKLK